MVAFILWVIQIALWWVVCFKSKTERKLYSENRYGNKEFVGYALIEDRYKFPLWFIILLFLSCLVPVFGVLTIVFVHIVIQTRTHREWEEDKPNLFLVDLFNKKI